MQPADFPNIKTLTLVGNHFVGNLLGHLDAALAVAQFTRRRRLPGGHDHPARSAGSDGQAPGGMERGQPRLGVLLARHVRDGNQDPDPRRDPVLNRFGLDCLSCHAQADAQWDFVCEKDHGCDPIPLTDQLIVALQQGDPRPT